MFSKHSFVVRCVTATSLALSIGVNALSFAAPGDINSTNNGQVVTGGTYLNTAGDKTTFTNTSGTGLHIQSGTAVRGLEVDAGGVQTGNGGHLHFNVPGQVVRVDGTIDVSAPRGSSGNHLLNGGMVTVDAAYMYQSGQIFANGVNGGTVNLNVGGLTLTGSARIEATGTDKRPDCFGNGGVVNIGTDQSKGVVDIQRGAIVDTSGQVVGSYDTNLITVQGGLINLDGLLVADGLRVQAPSGNIIDGTPGGTIALIAKGQTEQLDAALVDNTSFMSDIRNSVLNTDFDLISEFGNGWVNIGKTGQLSANGGWGSKGNGSSHGAYIDGTDGGDGGLITIWAKCGIKNDGLISARGGNAENGRNIEGRVIAGDQVSIAGDGGTGGLGGQVYLTYHQSLENNGLVTVKGGWGGNGGNALADATPTSFALAGNGGNGSQGGQIIIDGSAEPIGDGGYNITGGDAGKGGIAQTGGLPGQVAIDGVDGLQGENSVVFKFIDPEGACESCLVKPDPTPVEPPAPPSGAPESLVSSDELFGLYQSERPVFQEPQTREIPPLLIGLARNNMFFARTYKSVTQEILNLALREFNRQLALGQPDEKARDEARTLLKRSGVDASIATSLIEEIKNENLEASEVIQNLLKTISEEGSVSLNF